MNYTRHIILLFALLTLPVVASAQTDDPQSKNNKSEIKVNKLDVIYEDEEYKGVVIDRRNNKETESYMYQAPFLYEEEEEEDADEEGMPNIYTLDDEGAESEDDILLRTSVPVAAVSITVSTWHCPPASPFMPPSTEWCASQSATAATASWSSSTIPTAWRPTMHTCRNVTSWPDSR